MMIMIAHTTKTPTAVDWVSRAIEFKFNFHFERSLKIKVDSTLGNFFAVLVEALLFSVNNHLCI